MAQRQIPEERQTTYYAGLLLVVAGIVMFVGSGVAAVNTGPEPMLDALSGSPRSFGPPPGVILFFIMFIVGGVLLSIGRSGLAGSGLILDPEQERRDLEPWSRMGGGMLADALDEAGLHLGEEHRDELPFDERLRRLTKLRDDGLISADEFEATKARILAQA